MVRSPRLIPLGTPRHALHCAGDPAKLSQAPPGEVLPGVAMVMTWGWLRMVYEIG
jgi:hypothetical protein